MKQYTITKEYSFKGKGLHSGRPVEMILRPASPGTGIVFVRSDLGGVTVLPLAENVSNTARSTTLSSADGKAAVMTVEHILSACTGLGIDNMEVILSNVEVPILDGSAKPYIDAIAPDGLIAQDAEREYVTLTEAVEICDEKSGACVRIEPAEEFSYECKVDFNSHVLGVQTAAWNPAVDYSAEVGICRTFVFFHELEFLAANGLVKGGDVDNALVIVEHPVTDEQVARLAALFGMPKLQVNEGYLSNATLRFENECARHKLLDLIGDLRLCGGFLKAKVTAFKSGHGINTTLAKKVRETLNR